MQTISTLELVHDDSIIPTEFYDEQQRNRWRREVEAAAHQWQVRKMREWLAKPIGRQVTPGDDLHTMICAVQIIREQEPSYSVSKLALESGIPRSTLRERLNGDSVLTLNDIGRIASTLGVSPVEILELAAKARVTVGPPAGYVQAEGCSGRWVGPKSSGDGWTVMPSWNAEADLHSVELWASDLEDLSPIDALQLSAALAAASRTALSAGSEK